MKRNKQVGHTSRSGYTLPEVLVAAALALVVAGTAMGLFISTISSWNGVNLRMGADSDVNIAMSRMVYGMNGRFGLRCAASESVTIIADGSNGWTMQYSTGGDAPQNNSFTYSADDRTLVFNPGAMVVGRNISLATVARQDDGLVITLRMDKTNGRQDARREIVSAISFRNTL